MSPEKPKSPAAERLEKLIEAGGSVPVSLFMAYANAHYYATRDPLGADGDFTTAPEISQMFGELIGLWCADMWMRAGQPAVAYVELGPGRGTLAADALRSMKPFGLSPPVHFVETSPVLRDLQSAAVPGAQFHDDVSTLPVDTPVLVIANEFFDALPIRQLVLTTEGWRERVVTLYEGSFVPAAGRVPMDSAVPQRMRHAGIGAIVEASPAGVAIARDLAMTIERQGGAMLVIDYGYAEAAPGDTLQAVERHRYADAFAGVGERDITAHVDFNALAGVGRMAGLEVSGPTGQGDFLSMLGLDARSENLAAKHPARADEFRAQCRRLAHADQMGTLFKVLAMRHGDWPAPEGFLR